MSFWAGAGAALIGGIGSLLSGAASTGVAAASQRRQYQFNKALQKQQQEWQRQMWELSNFYNLPKNEVQRLLDAGINPALSFSNGGAAAAPVPVSGSAGGVSAPVGDIPNLGSVVSSALQAKDVESRVEVNDAQSDKLRAEAEAVRQEAGLTSAHRRIEEVYADAVEANRDIFKQLPRLDYSIKSITANLGYNKYIRDSVYTAAFPHENAMRLESMRLNNRLLRKEYDRMVATIDLERAKGRLTDEQVRSVCLQNDILFCERYAAQFSYNMSRIINQRVYGSADVPDADSKIIRDITERMKKDAANHLTNASVAAVSLNNDLHFERDYGGSMRFYQYEGVRRGANKTRADIYYGLIGSLSGLASSAISAGTAGASIRYRNAATKALEGTNRSFGLTVPYYRGGNVFIPDAPGSFPNF